MKHHFFFYSSGRLPSPAAHVIQILKTAHALAQSGGTRVTVEFLTMRESAESALAWLGLKPLPNLTLKGMIPTWVESMLRTGTSFDPERHWVWRKLRGRVQGEWADAKAKGHAPVVVTRKLEIAELLRPAARESGAKLLLEVHWLKQLDHYRKFIAKAKAEGRTPSLGERKAHLRRKRAEERDRMNQADGILCLTHGLGDRLRRMGVSVPLHHLPSGTDPVYVLPDHRPPPLRELDILYAGGLQPWKGIDTLIRAIPHMSGRRLRIIGEAGPERMAELLALAREGGAADRIEFAGADPQALVAYAILRSKVGVVPLPRAGFPEARTFTSPLKLLEYAAYGAAIVASDLPSIREVVTHDTTAWLVRPDDPQALAEGIRRVLDDPGLRDRISKGARLMAGDNSYESRAHRMIEAVEDFTAKNT